MNHKKLFHFTAGYLFGFMVFVILFPVIFYYTDYFFKGIIQTEIFRKDFLRLIAASIFFIPGIVFVLWSNASLFFTGKGGPAEGLGIAISPKTEALVAVGPYRYTRNPMVFGTYISYLGFSFYLNSWVCLILVVFMLPVSILYLKKSEEKRLLKDFGKDYLRYREKVSMFIPLPPAK